MSEFKVGDKVRVIDASEADEEVCIGMELEVTAIRNHVPYNILCNDEYFFYPEELEKIDE
jgi:hypothetical protein